MCGKLKNDRNISVREKVAQSAKISPKIIEELARDSVPLIRDRSFSVRRAVAENANTPIDTLKELLNDEALKIAESAKNNLNKKTASIKYLILLKAVLSILAFNFSLLH